MTDIRGDRQARRQRQAVPLPRACSRTDGAALLHHEPGWRLPGNRARPPLQRDHSQDRAAIELLGPAPADPAARWTVFRASPARYRVALEGLPGLSTQVDPMGGRWPARAATFPGGGPRRTSPGRSACPRPGVLTIRCLWTVGVSPPRYRRATCHLSWKGWPGNWPARHCFPGPCRGASAPGPSRRTFSRPPRGGPSLRLSAVNLLLPSPSGPRTPRSRGGRPDRGRPEAISVPHRGGVPGIPSPAVGPEGPPGGWTHALGGGEALLQMAVSATEGFSHG